MNLVGPPGHAEILAKNSDPLLSPVVYRKIRPPLTAIRGIRAIYREAEGLPTSVLEAMAIGVVPICLESRSGIREAIEH